MNIGRMRYRITLQQPANTTDDYGNIIDEWRDLATVWADIVPVSGREYFTADREKSETQYKIYMRYIDGISAKMRVIHNSIEYEILAVLADKRAGIITLMCKEVE